ncbi:hypothetical protein, partial [Herbaspirillum seropedicae]|uniref:hypothetical protein n=1 Tax=Herbaspirillum seropedicae TaxID=964 RepID=UPI0033960BD4
QSNGIGPAVMSPRALSARGRSLVCRRVAGEPAATTFRRGRLRYFGQAPDQAERRSPSCRRTERLLNGLFGGKRGHVPEAKRGNSFSGTPFDNKPEIVAPAMFMNVAGGLPVPRSLIFLSPYLLRA